MMDELGGYEIGTNDVNTAASFNAKEHQDSILIESLGECIAAGDMVLFVSVLNELSDRSCPEESLLEVFHEACTSGQLSHVLALLKFGINPNRASSRAETAVSSAATWGNDAILKALFENGARFANPEVSNSEEMKLIIENSSKFTAIEILASNDILKSKDARVKLIETAEKLGRIDISTEINKYSE